MVSGWGDIIKDSFPRDSIDPKMNVPEIPPVHIPRIFEGGVMEVGVEEYFSLESFPQISSLAFLVVGMVCSFCSY